GRRDDARRLADRELREALRYGAPRRHGLALATSASLDLSEAGLVGLRDAAKILDRCGAQLDTARVCVELGVRRHQRGERDAARSSLWEGLEIAHGCGAWALAERA